MVHADNLVHPDLNRDTAEDYEHAVVSYAGEAVKDLHYAPHSHRRVQLFHIVSGSVTVATDHGSFVVPPERALWIPSNVSHAVTYLQHSSLRYLFFRPDAVRDMPQQPSVIRLTPLLRELISTLLGYPRDAVLDGPASRLVAVILDQLAVQPVAPLYLPMPRSHRLRQAVREAAVDPVKASRLAAIASRAALSERSFQRHFRAETGISFQAWLRQARLMKAVELLSLHLPVGDVAERLGYEGPSAFIAAFRKAFGVTPARYFAADR